MCGHGAATTWSAQGSWGLAWDVAGPQPTSPSPQTGILLSTRSSKRRRRGSRAEGLRIPNQGVTPRTAQEGASPGSRKKEGCAGDCESDIAERPGIQMRGCCPPRGPLSGRGGGEGQGTRPQGQGRGAAAGGRSPLSGRWRRPAGYGREGTRPRIPEAAGPSSGGSPWNARLRPVLGGGRRLRCPGLQAGGAGRGSGPSDTLVSPQPRALPATGGDPRDPRREVRPEHRGSSHGSCPGDAGILGANQSLGSIFPNSPFGLKFLCLKGWREL